MSHFTYKLKLVGLNLANRFRSGLPPDRWWNPVMITCIDFYVKKLLNNLVVDIVCHFAYKILLVPDCIHRMTLTSLE